MNSIYRGICVVYDYSGGLLGGVSGGEAFALLRVASECESIFLKGRTLKDP